jgi:hypothetical protein
MCLAFAPICSYVSLRTCCGAISVSRSARNIADFSFSARDAIPEFTSWQVSLVNTIAVEVAVEVAPSQQPEARSGIAFVNLIAH